MITREDPEDGYSNDKPISVIGTAMISTAKIQVVDSENKDNTKLHISSSDRGLQKLLCSFTHSEALLQNIITWATEPQAKCLPSKVSSAHSGVI